MSRDDFIQALFLRFAYNEKQDWDAKKIQEEFRNLACTVAAFVRYKGIEPENSFIEEFTNILKLKFGGHTIIGKFSFYLKFISIFSLVW